MFNTCTNEHEIAASDLSCRWSSVLFYIYVQTDVHVDVQDACVLTVACKQGFYVVDTKLY